MADTPLSSKTRLIVLFVAFGGLLFDGMELGLMPIASLSIAKDLLRENFSADLGGDWFAWLTASLLLGAAIGGIIFGGLGDQIGRARALGVSILFYSLFAGAGYFVTDLWQMLALRFLVGLGVGGAWPNSVALVSECWPSISRPTVAGIVGAGINMGILILSQVAGVWHITPDSWRWLFAWSTIPALLGFFALFQLQESPTWLASRKSASTKKLPISELFSKEYLAPMMIGILLGSIPLVGAWASSKWMLPWADQVGGNEHGYKATTQGYWAVGAVLGSFFGAQLANAAGRRFSYFAISLGSTITTCSLFSLSAPLRIEFLPLVLCQGFITTLFFGWLPLYLPELFPTRIRATGTGIAYNIGRFATAIGVIIAGELLSLFNGSYAKVGATMGLVYALGMIVIWWAPDTSKKPLQE
ncbi:MAG: MFS transporter [Pirellulales bacterium]